jgi:uncharacterized protein YkwD
MFTRASRFVATLVSVSSVAVLSACSTSSPTAPSTLTISTHPQSQAIAPGDTATLTVAVNGTAPLSFQWYVGATGAVNQPIGGATAAAYTTPALATTVSYWVRVADATGTADSTTATVSVSAISGGAPQPVDPDSAPSITTQPEDRSVAPGESATLSVVASGTSPLTYQWFIGSSGTLDSPINGATSDAYTTPALSSTSTFWVRASNSAGAGNSRTVVITVEAAPGPTPPPTPPPSPPSGSAPAITAQPQDRSVSVGQVVELTVAANGTGPLSYQWYSGLSGTTASPVAGATGATYTTPALASNASYWARVSNAFGSADSAAAIITVTASGSGSPSGSTAFEDQVLTLVNQRRAAGAMCGSTAYPPAGPLTMNGSLRTAAQGHSQDMALQNYVSHTSLDGRTFDQRMRDAGYNGAFPWAENIAAGTSNPQAAVDGWMNSPGHCANTMSGNYHVTGIGYAFRAGSVYGHYWTQNFGGS